MAYQSYSISSKDTLGCRFLQDEERGEGAGICTAAVEPGGTADRQGIVVGMLIHGIHGIPVKGMKFDEVMQLVRKARAKHPRWTIELIHPMNQPAEECIRWATLLTEKGLNEFTQGDGDEKKTTIGTGLRRLSVAVGIKTHEEDTSSIPSHYQRSDEVGGGRRASVSSQGSDGPSSRRGSLTGSSPTAAGSGARGSIGADARAAGRRASISSDGGARRRGSIASQGSNDGMPPASPPAAQRRRGSISDSDSVASAGPPAARRRGSISSEDGTALAGAPAAPSWRGSISHGTALSPVPDPSYAPSVPTFSTGPQSIGKYRVTAKCTVREGKSGESTKVGEYPKGAILDVVEEAVNNKGLAVVRTTTLTRSGAMGGWVKMRTAKGKLLLEKLQGVRSGRRMSVASVSADGRTIAPEELIDVTFSGSGALGMLFEEIPSADGRPGDDIAIKKVVPKSIAADILDVQVGLILRNVNTTAIAGLAYAAAMKLIGSEWKAAEEMTLTFARPELVDDSEEEYDDPANQNDVEIAQGHNSPGGRRWVDGAAIEGKSSMTSSLDSQPEQVEPPHAAVNYASHEAAEPLAKYTSDRTPAMNPTKPRPETTGVPPEVLDFMEQNGAGEYAAKLCQSLGVARVQDFLDLEADDYEPLNMKTIPKRRLLKAVAAMQAAKKGSVEEAVPTLDAAQSNAPEIAEAPAEKPFVNVYISPFLDQPEMTVEMDRIRERMRDLDGQPGHLKCMRKDYTGWDTVESFNV